MYIGMDIGYSGLKVVVGGNKASCRDFVKPVGVIEDCSSNGLNIGGVDILRVLVDDTRYISCATPADLGAGYSRTLDKDYTKTINYKALFHSTLLLSSCNEIDVLTTGLPVNQFLIPENRTVLQTQVEGIHQVTAKKQVTVNKAVIVPQPFGGYMKYISEHADMLNRSILVFDPGFFSVDWVLVSKCNVDPSVLGTSVHAVSALFEKASLIISRDFGGNVSVDQIEEAVMSQSNKVYLFGDEIELEPILSEASNMIKGNLVNELKATLRSSKSDVDIVLMIGGGASLFRNVIQEVCPKSKLVEMNDSHMSNAEGFWNIAMESQL